MSKISAPPLPGCWCAACSPARGVLCSTGGTEDVVTFWVHFPYMMLALAQVRVLGCHKDMQLPLVLIPIRDHLIPQVSVVVLGRGMAYGGPCWLPPVISRGSGELTSQQSIRSYTLGRRFCTSRGKDNIHCPCYGRCGVIFIA